MVVIGVLHFVDPAPFVKIVPPQLPAPRALVYLSGVAEVVLGVGLTIPRLRRWAGLGCIALYLAVFPANLYQALAGVQFDPADPLPRAALYARLPFQLVFIAWAWWVSRDSQEARVPSRDG